MTVLALSPLSSVSILLGHTEIVKLLLDETTTDDLDEPDADGMTALHWACFIGATEILQMLIDRGSKLESITRQKETPLHIAAKRGHFRAVETLLDAGAHIDAMNGKGFTPLLLAAHVPYVDIAKRLIERGANYDLSMQKGSEDVNSLKPPRKYSPYPAWYTPTDSSTWYTGRPSTSSSSSSSGRPSTSISLRRPSDKNKLTTPTRTTTAASTATTRRTSLTPILPLKEEQTRNDHTAEEVISSKATSKADSSRTAAAMAASSFWSDVLNSINVDRSSSNNHKNDSNGITNHH